MTAGITIRSEAYRKTDELPSLMTTVLPDILHFAARKFDLLGQ